jgi:hypothetical protein
MKMVESERLASALACGKAATVYTNSRRFDDFDGDSAACFIASTAGSITVTQQCSNDGKNFYDPEDATAAKGAVEDALTVTTGRYIQFTPVICKFIRFKIVEADSAAAAVTLDLIYPKSR